MVQNYYLKQHIIPMLTLRHRNNYKKKVENDTTPVFLELFKAPGNDHVDVCTALYEKNINLSEKHNDVTVPL